MSLGTRIRRIVAALATFTASVSAVALPARGEVAGLIDEEMQVLNPTDSYGVIWAPMEREERAAVSALVEGINDINQYFDLEEEGLIAIARIDRFDSNDGTELVYEGIASRGDSRTDNFSDPSPNTVRSCGTGLPDEFYVKTKDTSITLVLTKDIWGDGSIIDVNYKPGCPNYPCTKTAAGVAGKWMMVDPLGGGVLVPVKVKTDFSWRSGTGSYNYWNTQDAWWWDTWSMSLYSGDSSINYLLRSCALDYQGLTITWTSK